VWVKREINLHEADRPASASTHDEVPDIRRRLSQFLAEVGMGDGDESFSSLPKRLSMQIHRTEFGEHRPHPIIGPKSNIFPVLVPINSTSSSRN